MVQPFRISDGDDPGRNLGGWDESGNVDIPGTLTVDTIRGSGANPAASTTTFTGQVAFSQPATAAGIQLPPGIFLPQDHGFETWSIDPGFPASSVISIAGRVYLTKLMIRRNISVDTIWWSIATAGVTPTAGQNEVGLYSSAGALLAAANVDAVISASGTKSTAITAQNLLAGTFVWVGFVFNAATLPTLVRGSSFESAPNINLAAATLRYAVNGAGATVLPASITPASNSATNSLSFFAALEAV